MKIKLGDCGPYIRGCKTEIYWQDEALGDGDAEIPVQLKNVEKEDTEDEVEMYFSVEEIKTLYHTVMNHIGRGGE